MSDKVVTLAVTGASGSPYFICLLQNLLVAKVNINLLFSQAAQIVINTELNISLPDSNQDKKNFLLNYFSSHLDDLEEAESLLNVFGVQEWTSPVASGSSPAHAMVICPCSMGTVSAISQGASNNLIERAADVILKEKRQLILLPREMPFSSIHLENMLKLSRMGVTIMPASPGFYHQPESIEDLVSFVVARILDHLGIEHSLAMRWGKI